MMTWLAVTLLHLLRVVVVVSFTKSIFDMHPLDDDGGAVVDAGLRDRIITAILKMRNALLRSLVGGWGFALLPTIKFLRCSFHDSKF